MGRSLTLGVLALLLGTACKERAPTPPPAPSLAPSVEPPLTPLPERAVSGEVAFELLAVDDGAVLAWGSPNGLRIALLDARGGARGEPLAVPDAPKDSVIELAGGSLGSRVGLAFVTRSAAGAESWGTLGDAETRSFSPVFSLADATLGDVTKRGHVGFAVSDKNEMVALVRGRDEPCAEAKGPSCAQFRFRELLATGPELRGLPISVPSPCSTPLAGFELVKERWHYGFCSVASGRPDVTTFMRQVAPFYVGVATPAAGCSPLGAARVAEDALFVLQCGDLRRGVRIGDLNSSARGVDLSAAKLECALGRPLLSAPGTPPLRIDLTGPLSGLGPLLPPAFAAPTARAVWTGSTLLVGSWMAGKVVLRRFECRSAEMARTG